MKQKGVFIIYPTHGEQQQNEIKTIRKRVLELKLSDEDVKRISEKAGAVGLSVAELIENFIGDLVCGTYSNGSDERMYAEQWFERCGFGMFPENTFLRYLVEWGGGVDNVIALWEDIQSAEEEIAHIEAEPEEYEPDEKAAYEEDIKDFRERLDEYWKEYAEQKKDEKHGTFDEEMKKVIEWWQEYQRFLKSCPAGIESQNIV